MLNFSSLNVTAERSVLKSCWVFRRKRTTWTALFTELCDSFVSSHDAVHGNMLLPPASVSTRFVLQVHFGHLSNASMLPDRSECLEGIPYFSWFRFCLPHLEGVAQGTQCVIFFNSAAAAHSVATVAQSLWSFLELACPRFSTLQK